MTLLSTLFVLGLLLVGCSSSDSDPSQPYGGGGTQLSADEAEDWTDQALTMMNEMALQIPTVAEGDFTQTTVGKNAEAPIWDGDQQAWIMDETAEFGDGVGSDSYGEMRVAIWIQFRNDDGPLPTALGATELEYRLSSGMTMHNEDSQGTGDLDYDLETTMLVEYVDGGYNVDGEGAAGIDASYSSGGQTENMSFDMAWGMDLSVPLNGCPSGSAWVEAAQYRLGALYDGQGNVAWSLGAPGYEASGTDTVPCSSIQ